jgi:hypothetical protein
MHVIVFVTDEGNGRAGTAPLLFLRDNPASHLPPHPRSLTWRYFATMPIEDQMFAGERHRVEAAFAAGEPYISKRLVG